MSDVMAATLHRAWAADLDPGTLYEILRLRVDVFVVEQQCPYPEIDGRDDEPATRHVWWAEPGGPPVAYVRVLDEDGARRIGRVVTARERRGERLAETLVRHVLASSEGPWVLDAQAHLAGWYRGLGFSVTGPEFLDDGIPHVPMRRAVTGAAGVR
jgi:ElaA protein